MGVGSPLPSTATPLVGSETGEFRGPKAEIVHMARLKLGSGTVTSSGSSSAQTATLNSASGVITTGTLSIAQDATATITLTNSKVQAGDTVLATVDSTGATANSQPYLASVQVSAGTIAFIIGNPASTTLATGVKINFLVATKGNSN